MALGAIPERDPWSVLDATLDMALSILVLWAVEVTVVEGFALAWAAVLAACVAVVVYLVRIDLAIAGLDRTVLKRPGVRARGPNEILIRVPFSFLTPLAVTASILPPSVVSRGLPTGSQITWVDVDEHAREFVIAATHPYVDPDSVESGDVGVLDLREIALGEYVELLAHYASKGAMARARYDKLVAMTRETAEHLGVMLVGDNANDPDADNANDPGAGNANAPLPSNVISLPDRPQ